MWVRSSSEITESVFQLTTPVSSHVLVDADAPTLIDTSVSVCSERLIQEIENVLGDRELAFVLLTSIDFDTLGGLPALRVRYPNLELIVSPREEEFLKESDRMETLLTKNKECAAAFSQTCELTKEQWTGAFEVSKVLSAGDSLLVDEDGIQIKFISTTGYSEDGTSFLVTPDQVLVAGEAGGVYAGRGKIAPNFKRDYASFIEGLDKFSGLDIKALSLPHSGTLSGELGVRYLTELIEESKRFVDATKEKLSTGEIVEEISIEVFPEWTSLGLTPGGPFADVVKENIRAMIQQIADGV